MRIIAYDVFLESGVIQTVNAASLGVHQSLTYLRGSNFLGAFAARLYQKLGLHAFVTFHSGQVRFLDALPISPAGGAHLVPLGWLRVANTSVVQDSRYVSANIYCLNHLEDDLRRQQRCRRMEEGYFRADGRVIGVDREYRLKTAVSRDRRGAPAEGSLFGYESLAAGSSWRSHIQLDDDVSPDVDARLQEELARGTFWIGRSRSAEYGRIRTMLVDTAAVKPSRSHSATTVTLVLNSDTALADPLSGEPAQIPHPAHFGFPEDWKLVVPKSAWSVRRFVPYNGKRRSRDLERRVLERGSTLTFAGATKVDVQALEVALESGVGLFRQEGLGQVVVEPWFLATLHPEFREYSAEQQVPVGQKPESPLADWILEQSRQVVAEERVVLQAEVSARELSTRLGRARRKRDPVPSRSQWNAVAQACALACRSGAVSFAELEQTLRQEHFGVEAGTGGVGANTWRTAISGKPLYEWFLEATPQEVGEAEKKLCLHLTAHLVARRQSRLREGVQA